jgi:NAD(P)-dependent dehydrogenase (short-subunit alcohol dehydrogenase family)
MTSAESKYSIGPKTLQSPPIDVHSTIPIDASWVKDKTILITGGASGFGAGFFSRWAAYGANVIIGDVSTKKGEALVESVRTSTGNKNLHFLPLDVTDWKSQVEFFREAVKLSTHGGIDAVVANAGITGASEASAFQEPSLDLSGTNVPPPPSLKVYETNLTGVLYTTHLALYYLPLNPGSASHPPKSMEEPSSVKRDRHILLIGSLASFVPIASLSLYGVAKHGVLGLFRCLRATATISTGVRVNILCPGFIDTPLIDGAARAVLAGEALGTIQDVVEAATRFVADPRVVGRSLAVGPRIRVKDDGTAEEMTVPAQEGGEEKAIWEIYAHDFDEVDVFTKHVIGMVNLASAARGWAGFIGDLIGAAAYPLKRLWRGWGF